MRHTTSLSRRAAAFLLALLLALPTVYAAAGDQKLQTSTQIVDGLTYRNTVTMNNNSRVESYALELSPDSPAKPILIQGSETIYAGASITRAVANAQAAGYHVLGAVNTDFFAMSTGVPIGMVIEDGIYKSSNGDENAMAISGGTISILDVPRVSLSLYDQNTGVTVIPNQFNKTRHVIGGIFLLNEDFSTVSTRSSGSGWYVRMKAAADPDSGEVPGLTVNSTLTLEVTELLQSDESIVIGPDEYILTAADESGRLDTYQSFQLGDVVTLTTTCDDPVLSAAQWACGVGDILVRDGAVTDSSAWVYAKDGHQPRTAMGIKADGTVVFYAVDGRQSAHSVGLSQYDLAQELLNQGCVTVVNLDGGGSTALSLWVPGQSGPAVQNKPSGGSLRACATYLLLVTDQRGDGTPVRLASGDNGQVVLAGSSLTLSQPKAVDAGLNLVPANLDRLTYTSRNGLGTVSGNVYTAGSNRGTDTLRFTAGSLEGSAQIHVVNSLTEFKVTRAGSTSALTSLAVKPGDQVQLAASGSYYGRTALREFAPVTVSVQGDVGSVDVNGLFTASQSGASGTITFSAGGLSQTVKVVSTYVHNDVLQGHWAYDAVEYCYQKNICSGISPTQFGPNNSMIRGDFMLMLYNAAGKPAPSAPCTFEDVPETAYYYTALAWAQNVGLASGTGDGNFSPKDPITREQAFALLYRFLPILGKNCPDGALTFLDSFQDKDQVASYARTATATLVSQGLASGDNGALRPKDTLTRAQMASLLYRVMEHTPIALPVDPEPPADPGTGTDPGNHTIALDQSQVTLNSGVSTVLKAVLLPAVEGAQITWSSSNPDAAPVDANGTVTNLYPGAESTTVTITASWNGLTSSCTVTCQPAQQTGTVTNAENGLNVRSGPGTTYDKVGALRNESQVVVMGKEEGWYQILFRNAKGLAAIGYVSADYLTIDR